MSKHAKHVPQHRAPRARPALPDAPRRVVRTTVVLSSVAVAATGASVAGGVAASGTTPTIGAAALAGQSVTGAAEASSPVTGLALGGATDAAAGAEADTPAAEDGDTAPVAAELGERAPVVSRSDRRDVTDPAKEQALTAEDAPAMTASEDLADNDPREIGRALLGEYGFSSDQFSCLDSLWTKESNWTVTADNPTSSAYGIPQSLPGSKMASEGSDWATNPVTQIRWGLGYIQDRYGSPCSAWSHSQAVNWY